jgi:NTE family protein
MPNQPDQIRIALALGSGGWRGFAHIGVIKSLLSAGYTISGIAGASAGSLIGGLYAVLQDIDQIEEIVKTFKYTDILNAFTDFSVRQGLIKGEKIQDLIDDLLHQATFADTKIPFKTVATDLQTGEPYIFDQGNIAQAIRASCSVPLLFEPYAFDGKLLIDGGLASPVPVYVAQTLPHDFLVAVNLHRGIIRLQKTNQEISKSDIVGNINQLLLHKLAKFEMKAADIIVEPKPHLQFDPFFKPENTQKAITAGETAMNLELDHLRQLTLA